MLENMHAEAATQLRSANPDDWPVAPGWQALTAGFFASAEGRSLLDFLRQLAPMDEATFRPLQQRLAAQIRASRPPEARALSALRQEYGLPELTPQAVDALRVAEVADLAREMTRRRRRWQVLFTTGD